MFAILGIVAFLAALVIGRLASMALMMTGLSKDVVRFQSRSALTGAGFTTRESESAVSYPVRRRIVNERAKRGAGDDCRLPDPVAQRTDGGPSTASRLIWLGGGFGAFLLLANGRWVGRILDRAMAWAPGRWTNMELLDHAALLRLQEGYRVTRFRVPGGSWLAGKDVGTLRLREAGITLFPIERFDSEYVAVPTSGTRLHPEDSVVLYGRDRALRELFERRKGPAGDGQHERARDDENVRRQRRQAREAAREAKRVDTDGMEQRRIGGKQDESDE